MTNITQGSLTLIGLNTDTPTVYWKGKLVPGLLAASISWKRREQVVKLKLSGNDYQTDAEMQEAGITLKKRSRHE